MKLLLRLLTPVLGLAMLAGCVMPVAAPAAAPAATETPAAEAPASTTAFPVTISHEGGETTFDSVPQRVVVLEYSYLDALFAMGVMPVGYADDGVPAYLAKRLEGSSAEPVGTRNEPNLEAIAILRPDLIIADRTRHEAIYDQLAAIGPTLMFDSYRGSYETQLTISTELAVLFEQQVPVATAIAALRDELAAAQQLAEGHERNIVVGVFAGTGFTAHSNSSFMGSLLSDLGLTTALEPQEGQTQYLLDLEGLAATAPDAFVVTCSPDDRGIWNDFMSQPVWQGLDAVKNNAVYVFNRDLWSRSRGILALHLILRDMRDSGLLAGTPSQSTICPDAVVE